MSCGHSNRTQGEFATSIPNCRAAATSIWMRRCCAGTGWFPGERGVKAKIAHCALSREAQCPLSRYLPGHAGGSEYEYARHVAAWPGHSTEFRSKRPPPAPPPPAHPGSPPLARLPPPPPTPRPTHARQTEATRLTPPRGGGAGAHAPRAHSRHSPRRPPPSPVALARRPHANRPRFLAPRPHGTPSQRARSFTVRNHRKRPRNQVSEFRVRAPPSFKRSHLFRVGAVQMAGDVLHSSYGYILGS